MTRVLVCGGRDFKDAKSLWAALDALVDDWPDLIIIEGDARGADRIASNWAKARRVANLKFPANWAAYGSAAGPMRNQQMLDEGKPDIVVAFPGSSGTRDMVARARKAAIPVIQPLSTR
jgi:cysteine synthase